MSERDVDVVVIGAGTAGLSALRAARKAGARGLLIDRGPLGTTCARVGCMPSKLLIAAAHAAHAIHEAPKFGIRVAAGQVDGPAVLERLRRERDRFVAFVLEDCRVLEERGELLRGTARIVGEHALQVDEHTRVHFKSLVVATGSAPFIPPMYAGLPDLLTTDTVFELPDLPASVLVIGTGAIGLELGQALHRLGVRVTVLGIKDTVGPLRDPVVKAVAKAALAAEFELHTDAVLEHIEAGGDGVLAQFRGDDGVVRSRTCARVLVAAGRRGNLGGLGLEHAGVRFDKDGRPEALESHTLQVGSTPVFIAGDAAGLRPLLHEAADEGHIAGANAAGYPGGVTPHARRTKLGIVFTDPGIAVVGGGSAKISPETHATGEIDWSRQGRARVIGKNVGMTRIYATRMDGVLRGAEIAGPGAEHMAHLLAWAVQQGLCVEDALRMPFYHPVLEEGLRTALQALKADLHKGTDSLPPGCAPARAAEQLGEAKD